MVITAIPLISIPMMAACGGDPTPTHKAAGTSTATSPPQHTLFIGGVPDQNTARLTRRFGGLADYLSERLGVDVEYVQSVDYAALVVGFRQGDIHLGWFGGLTGVQARAADPGAEAIAQRPRDTEFHSVFIVQTDLEVESLKDLQGLTFTFGSENSTSGHLMPRHFLDQAGIDPEEDFDGVPGFSGSHDKTWKLVESGSYQAGALNEAVWQRAVDKGNADPSKVRKFYTTPPYYDYNWTIRSDADTLFGAGFKDKVQAALMEMHQDPEQAEILDMFQTESFIESNNENYQAIEDVAKGQGIIQ
jgi:phosphonate transport system substrate-binding protein